VLLPYQFHSMLASPGRPRIPYLKSTLTLRSPWTNAYLPTPTDGPVPSSKLRQLEQSLNGAFDTYREMYFEGGISSVYLWDLEDDAGGPGAKDVMFAGVVLMKKSNSPNA
jgi:capping protein beta